MRDNDLARLFIPLINTGLTAVGFAGVSVVQSNQPTQQGTRTAPTVYYFKIGDYRYGFLKREDVWDADLDQMVHSEIQQYETTFQISGLVIQKPTNAYSYTASDLVNEVAAIMQSDLTRNTLMESNVGILRVGDVRNPYFADDKDRFEASPSFDFVLTHLQTRIIIDPVIDSFEFDIKRV